MDEDINEFRTPININAPDNIIGFDIYDQPIQERGFLPRPSLLRPTRSRRNIINQSLDHAINHRIPGIAPTTPADPYLQERLNELDSVIRELNLQISAISPTNDVTIAKLRELESLVQDKIIEELSQSSSFQGYMGRYYTSEKIGDIKNHLARPTKIIPHWSREYVKYVLGEPLSADLGQAIPLTINVLAKDPIKQSIYEQESPLFKILSKNNILSNEKIKEYEKYLQPRKSLSKEKIKQEKTKEEEKSRIKERERENLYQEVKASKNIQELNIKEGEELKHELHREGIERERLARELRQTIRGNRLLPSIRL